MYDPSWPHGHTYNGMKCHVLTTNIHHQNSTYPLTITITWDSGDAETVSRATPEELMPVPAPKRRIKGWLNVYPSSNGSGTCGDVHDTKEAADRAIVAYSKRVACLYLDFEEGEGLSNV